MCFEGLYNTFRALSCSVEMPKCDTFYGLLRHVLAAQTGRNMIQMRLSASEAFRLRCVLSRLGLVKQVTNAGKHSECNITAHMKQMCNWDGSGKVMTDMQRRTQLAKYHYLDSWVCVSFSPVVEEYSMYVMRWDEAPLFAVLSSRRKWVVS